MLSSITKCALAVILATISVFPQNEPKRTISADFTQVKGKTDRFYREVVGAGRAAEGLRADWQRDLAVARRECGFRYIRFH